MIQLDNLDYSPTFFSVTYIRTVTEVIDCGLQFPFGGRL